MPRKRSKPAIIRRFIRRLVSKESHKDYGMAENVNLMTDGQIVRAVFDKFRGAMNLKEIGVLLELERGEIISDSRGQGTLQRMLPG